MFGQSKVLTFIKSGTFHKTSEKTFFGSNVLGARTEHNIQD